MKPATIPTKDRPVFGTEDYLLGSNFRLISLIRRWLKAGFMEDGAVHPIDEGTPQGGSISVQQSNLYLHYVLDTRLNTAWPEISGR
ncbi:hypothetical protein LRP31_33605 (plasmid) [Mesorhizobium mediterraneum]|uniref:hypothetical protein n=1 Tax=Mesorhizobium mediterraneum TaxID=43617 RepID=UPI001FD90EE7|nr:hypothetical protein [Mesorhizobium mediterraneum]WIW57062.1 hypothetical protein LRP31_33605 [Mesorhizobium mediterraneum]